MRKPGTVGRSRRRNSRGFSTTTATTCRRDSPARSISGRREVGRFEYFKAPEKTAQSYRGDWFTLGDMGYLDEDGYLFLNGRNAETIISGGVNIYPQEIDSELMKHPGRGRRVHGRRAERRMGRGSEERGAARTTGQVGSPELAAELIAFARSRLPDSKRRGRSISSATYRVCRAARSSAGTCERPTGPAATGRSEVSAAPSRRARVRRTASTSRPSNVSRGCFPARSRSTVRVSPSAMCVALRFQCSNPSRARSNGDLHLQQRSSACRDGRRRSVRSLFVLDLADLRQRGEQYR